MSSPDILVRNATIYDGSGGAPYRGDIRLEGDRIAAVGGQGSPNTSAEVIDAEGLAVCPGFIDIHGHSDLVLLHTAAPDIMGPFVAQGITTQVIGNCGLGVAPTAANHRAALSAFMALISPPDVELGWQTFAEYMDTLEAAPLPLNIVPLAAHGALRCSVVGSEPGPARGGALDAMIAALDEALATGAFGLSAGLIYPPGMWSDTEELVALCERVAPRDGLFACHVRGSSETALEAESELLEIARRTGVRTQHSHHEAFGAPFWHLARQTLAMEDEARAAGLDIASDVIPYHAVNTSLLAIYPPWALAGGVDALCARLTDPPFLNRMETEILERAPEWPPWNDGWAHNLIKATGWENVIILQAASSAHAGWMGRSLSSIAARENKSPFACAVEITTASRGDVMARYHGVAGSPDDDGVLEELMRHPDHAIGVDVILKGDGLPHPGGYGALPRLLGYYARERDWFDIGEAIRKVTALPAARLGLPDRGLLRPGYAADLVVFEPATVGERGTYDTPERPPAGIEAVIVNGRVVARRGELVHTSAGSLLRRRASP